MNTSFLGRRFVARHEAAVLVPYQDGAFFSIGFGHNDKALSANSPAITFDKAWRLLGEDLAERDKVLNSWLTVPTLQHEFDGLSSAYFQAGSKIKRVALMINAGLTGEAMALLLTFNLDNNVFSDGLAERRNQERRLFRRGDYGDAAKPVPKLRVYSVNPKVVPNAPFAEVDLPEAA